MRFARALLASLGASTCLVLAGTLAMATLSTIVAFSGLPGLNSGDAGSPPVAVLAAATPPASVAGGDAGAVALAMPSVPSRLAASRRSAVPRPALSVAAAGQPPSQRSAPVTRPNPGRGVIAPSPIVGPDGQTEPVGAREPGDPIKPPVLSTAPLTAPVRELGTKVGETVATGGDGLAETLTPVSPPVAAVVGETGKVAGDTVEAVTEAVAGVLDGLLGR